MPRKSPLATKQPALPDTHTSPLQSLPAMPVILRYKARLQTVTSTSDGETVFSWRDAGVEAAHTYLKMVGDLAKREDVSEALKSDYRKVLALLGADDAESLTRQQLKMWVHLQSDKVGTKANDISDGFKDDFQRLLGVKDAGVLTHEQQVTWSRLQGDRTLQPLDARALTAEFFAVRTERDALNFLRHNGPFFPNSDFYDAVSWREFQLWQSYAELIKERTTLATVHEAILNGSADNELKALDPDGRLRLAIRAIFGEMNTYFSWPMGLAPEFVEALENEIDQALFESDPEYIRIFCEEHPGLSLFEVSARIYNDHRDLQQWFAQPPASACSIIHRRRSSDISGYAAKRSALLCLVDPANMVPVLRIDAKCSLHAIAATLYADRIAGVVIRRCKGCNSLFNALGAKTFCSTRCKNRVRTQDFRDRKKAQEAQKASPAKRRR